MTKQKKRKRAIRAHKAKMGRSYSAARRAVLGGQPPDPTPPSDPPDDDDGGLDPWIGEVFEDPVTGEAFEDYSSERDWDF